MRRKSAGRRRVAACATVTVPSLFAIPLLSAYPSPFTPFFDSLFFHVSLTVSISLILIRMNITQLRLIVRVTMTIAFITIPNLYPSLWIGWTRSSAYAATIKAKREFWFAAKADAPSPYIPTASVPNLNSMIRVTSTAPTAGTSAS